MIITDSHKSKAGTRNGHHEKWEQKQKKEGNLGFPSPGTSPKQDSKPCNFAVTRDAKPRYYDGFPAGWVTSGFPSPVAQLHAQYSLSEKDTDRADDNDDTSDYD